MDIFSPLSSRLPLIVADLPLAPSIRIHDEPVEVGGMLTQVRLELRRRVRLRPLHPDGEKRLALRCSFPPVQQLEDAVCYGTQKLCPSERCLMLHLDEVK